MELIGMSAEELLENFKRAGFSLEDAIKHIVHDLDGCDLDDNESRYMDRLKSDLYSIYKQRALETIKGFNGVDFDGKDHSVSICGDDRHVACCIVRERIRKIMTDAAKWVIAKTRQPSREVKGDYANFENGVKTIINKSWLEVPYNDLKDAYEVYLTAKMVLESHGCVAYPQEYMDDVIGIGTNDIKMDVNVTHYLPVDILREVSQKVSQTVKNLRRS